MTARKEVAKKGGSVEDFSGYDQLTEGTFAWDLLFNQPSEVEIENLVSAKAA
jgi:hypothetical protein